LYDPCRKYKRILLKSRLSVPGKLTGPIKNEWTLSSEVVKPKRTERKSREVKIIPFFFGITCEPCSKEIILRICLL
jgi:hypothetical protein